MGWAVVGNSDEQLLAILAQLEECRAALRLDGRLDTAELLSVAILDLRMKLNRIGDAELKALCEELMRPDDEPQRRRPLLRVVK
jgi:hypothetical protein